MRTLIARARSRRGQRAGPGTGRAVDNEPVRPEVSSAHLSDGAPFDDEKRPFFLEGRKIFDFPTEGSDRLFYERRIGQPPHRPPPVPGETIRSPESTTILSAMKVTGKTNAGLSVGVLQTLTQKESARISTAALSRRSTVEPFGSYTVARIHKDWDKGNTSLGGMFTQTHRFIRDAALAFLPADSTTGGIDFNRYLANRKWVVEANGVFNSINGDRAAILERQTSAVHYYQRLDAKHLGVDATRTSIAGHGGSVRAGTSDTGRLRLTDHFHWYSPGLDLNDVGYLRQADVIANQVFVGWSESRPRGIFRDYSFEVSHEDQWDFGRLHTNLQTRLEASSTFSNKWGADASLAYNEGVDTRALRGGPALRTHDYYEGTAGIRSDAARRTSFWLEAGKAWSVDDDSRATDVDMGARLRLSNRLALSGAAQYESLLDSLQYVTTIDSTTDPRYLLGRIDQDTWRFTFRANFAVT